MARSKNSVSLIGIAGKDAELRKTQQGVHYALISIATSTGGYKKQDGTEVPEVTQWHHVVAWNNLGDFAGKYIKKGMRVAVDGMITYRSYKNQQGVDVYITEIVAKDMVLMTQPQQAQNNQPQQGAYQAINYQQSQQAQQVVRQAQPMQQNNTAPFPPSPEADLPF